MAKYFKNITSDNIVMVAIIMIFLILMTCFSFVLLSAHIKSTVLEEMPVIVEISDPVDYNLIKTELEAYSEIDSSTIELIKKDNFGAIYNESIEKDLINRIKATNVIKDIIRFSLKADTPSDRRSEIYNEIKNYEQHQSKKILEFKKEYVEKEFPDILTISVFKISFSTTVIKS